MTERYSDNNPLRISPADQLAAGLPLMEDEAKAQQFVDDYSFAGYSNGRNLSAGKSAFWDTQTFRGPENVVVSNQIQASEHGVEPDDGTVIAIRAGEDAHVFTFNGSRGNVLASHFYIHDIDGAATVELGDQVRLHKTQVITLQVDAGRYAKVFMPADYEPSGELAAEYDALRLSDEQQAECGLAFNVVTALRGAALSRTA